MKIFYLILALVFFSTNSHAEEEKFIPSVMKESEWVSEKRKEALTILTKTYIPLYAHSLCLNAYKVQSTMGDESSYHWLSYLSENSKQSKSQSINASELDKIVQKEVEARLLAAKAAKRCSPGKTCDPRENSHKFYPNDAVHFAPKKTRGKNNVDYIAFAGVTMIDFTSACSQYRQMKQKSKQ